MPVPNLNRSSSPLSSRPTPNSRISESNSTTRKSFSGNPFQKPSPLVNPRSFNPSTPANSPSGFRRPQSGHYESSDPEKENDQSFKPVKSRSAAIGIGSKNFMAPTISAACKMSPSPRKKVLVDRNDAVRTSISLSEGKATFFSSNDEDQKNAEAYVPKVLKRVSFAVSSSTLDSGNSTEFGADSVVSDSDCVVTDLDTKNKSFCDPNIAPLDADPLVPPYDPKTNYLSPRPQFLHYKPNERIEIVLNKENGFDDEGIKLFEDNLSSIENSSDTDELQKDSEDSSAAEIEPLKVREEDVHGSETMICGGSNNHENSEKRGLVTRLGLILLLVVLMVSCFSILVTYSPGIDSTMLKAMNISQLHQPGGVLIDLAKANFNGFTQKFKQLSVESISHLSLLINNFGQKDHLSSPLQFINLTELQNNNFDDGYPKIQQRSEKSPEYLELDYMEEERDDMKHEVETFGDSKPYSSSENEVERDGNDLVVLTEAFPAAAGGPIGGLASETICNQGEEISQVDTDWQDNVVPYNYDVDIASEAQEVVTESSLEEVEGNVKPSSEDINLQTESDVSIESTPAEFEGQEVLTESEDTKLQTESDISIVSSPAELEGYLNLDSSDTKVETFLSENISLKTPSDIIPHPTTELPAYYIMGATALTLAVMSIAFAVYKNKRRGNNTNELPNGANVSTMEQMYQEKQFSQNWPTEDDVGESCSSEMSSFQRYTSQYDNNRLRSEYEAQSGRGERMPRKYSKRESFSSSDFSLGGGGNGGSSSYGSFTTFERIPIKNATGDDEVVTPVRRSSRLRRSQITS